METFDVEYFDTVNGGSGQVRLSFDGITGLMHWLSAHPGYLIRSLRKA